MSVDLRREQLLGAAVAAGKFPENRKALYRRLYDADPAGTTRVIAELVPLPDVSAALVSDEEIAAAARAAFPELSRRRRRRVH